MYAGGSGCIDPRFLDLCTIWKWVLSFTRLPLYPQGKSSPYLLDKSWVGLRTGLDNVKRRKILPLPGFELRSLGHPARNAAAISTSLSRLVEILHIRIIYSALLKECFSRFFPLSYGFQNPEFIVSNFCYNLCFSSSCFFLISYISLT
jgi:hypothetical protein